MIAVKSKFQFDDFLIINCNYKFIPAEEDDVDPKVFMDKYVIDFDFTFKKGSEGKAIMLCKVHINKTEELPGYSIFIEGIGIFEESLTQEENASQIPAVSYGFSQLRNMTSLITSQGPFGKYQIPLIKATDLLKEKQDRLSRFKSARKESKK